MRFVCFVLDSLPLFSMIVALMLSWRNFRSSTAYTCTSMKYIDHRNCGKASYTTTILASIEIVQIIFFFCDTSIIETDTMDIIALV